MACGCPCGEPIREDPDAPLLDLEEGPGHGHTAAPPQPMPDDATESKVAMEKAFRKIARCTARGLLVLLWVYSLDLFRRFVTTHSEGAWIMMIFPSTIFVSGLTIVLLYSMERMDESISPTSTTKIISN